jgi:hypothetical protein
MRAVLAPVLSVAFLLVGCGGSSDPDAGQVALIAQDWAHSGPGKCTKVRDAGLSGRVVTLYDCRMEDVDEPQHRLMDHFTETTQHYCFAFANDSAIEMTERFGVACAG